MNGRSSLVVCTRRANYGCCTQQKEGSYFIYHGLHVFFNFEVFRIGREEKARASSKRSI